MKTTLNIKKELLEEASKATGIVEKTALIHYGLEELINIAARKRLINLGGIMKNAKAAKRARSVNR